MIYRIKNWSEHYENNRTKDLKEMKWVPIPNSHDGEGYCHMVSGPEGAAVLGAWVACVQVASRCEPRGVLIRKSGEPHTAETLAMRTRLPVIAFTEMIIRAASPSVGWLELVDSTLMNVVTIPHPPAGISQSPAVPSFPSLPFPSVQEGVKGEKQPLTEMDIRAVYEAYPRKVAPAAAMNAIRKTLVKLARSGTVKPDAGSWLLEKVQRFANSPAGKSGHFTPHPATWFNDERYYDDESEWNKTGTEQNAPTVRRNAFTGEIIE